MIDDIESDIFDDEDDDEDGDKTSKTHRAIPSWQDAISMVVDKNLSSRSGRPDSSRGSRPRGGRGRSSGRRGSGGRPKE
jgi:hypothetical protein